MNKNYLLILKVLLLALIVNVSETALGQNVVSTAGESSEEFSYTIGEVVIGDNIGMWSIDGMLDTSIKQVFTKDAVEIHSLGFNGNIEVVVKPEALANGAYVCLYSVNGMQLKRERISTERTIIETKQFANGTPLILSVSIAGKVVTTVKLMNKK